MTDLLKDTAKEYRALLEAFVGGSLAVENLNTEFMTKFKAEPAGRLDRPLFFILEDFFEDLDAYSPMWAPEDESPTRITEATLRKEAEETLAQLEQYLTVGVLPKEEVVELYKLRGLQRGGGLYLTPGVALELVATCQLNDLCILGIESFEITETYTWPDMEWIADYSPKKREVPFAWNDWAQRCNTAAVWFINSVPPRADLMFNFTLWSRHEYEQFISLKTSQQ